MILFSNSEKETYEIGKKLGENAESSLVVSLDGELGTGKTVFSKGFAKGLGVEETVCSPTFTIVQEYSGGRLTLNHFDVYRIEDEDEMFEIGFDEYIHSDGVCLIEWGERIKGILPKDALFIKIEKENEKGFDFRKIEIDCSSEEHMKLIEELFGKQ